MLSTFHHYNEYLRFILVHSFAGFIPWLVSLIAFGFVVRQHIMVGSGKWWRKLFTSWLGLK
jgi:hypothetical protein